MHGDANEDTTAPEVLERVGGPRVSEVVRAEQDRDVRTTCRGRAQRRGDGTAARCVRQRNGRDHLDRLLRVTDLEHSTLVDLGGARRHHRGCSNQVQGAFKPLRQVACLGKEPVNVVLVVERLHTFFGSFGSHLAPLGLEAPLRIPFKRSLQHEHRGLWYGHAKST